MKYSPSLLVATAASIFALAPTSEAATVVFSDNFNDVASSNVNADGWYAQHNSSGGTPWAKLDPTSPETASPLSGGVMRDNIGTQQSTVMAKQWDTITLANTGDYITLSLDVQSTGTAGNLGIYLFDTSYEFTANVIGSPSPTTDAKGYAYFQGYASADMVYRSLNNDVATSFPTTQTGSTAINATGGHTIVFTITRTDTGLTLSSSFDGDEFGTEAVASPLTYDFNTVRLTSFNLNQPAYFDNISLTTNVPEPSTVALMFGSLAFLLFRRRRA